VTPQISEELQHGSLCLYIYDYPNLLSGKDYKKGFDDVKEIDLRSVIKENTKNMQAEVVEINKDIEIFEETKAQESEQDKELVNI